MVNMPKHCCKKSLLLTCQILVLVANIWAADEKCLVLHRNNLMIAMQMQLSEKQKTFSDLFGLFLKSKLNFDHFFKKDDPQSFFISQITDAENVVR